MKRKSAINLLILILLISGVNSFALDEIIPLSNFDEAEQYLGKEITPKGSNWFKEYTNIQVIDGIYKDIAEQLGGVAIIGGSDLSEIMFGDGVKISTREINVLHPLAPKLINELVENSNKINTQRKTLDNLSWGDALDKYADLGGISRWNEEEKEVIALERKRRTSIAKKIFPTSSPTWLTGNSFNNSTNMMVDLKHGAIQERSEIKINFGEMNKEYEIYKENFNKGVSVADGTFGLWSSLKSRYLVIINELGETRLYFRDSRAKDDYNNRIMRLPDEHLLSVDPLKSIKSNEKLFDQVRYNLILLARGKRQGWSYSPKSIKIIRGWSKRILEDPDTLLSFKWNIAQSLNYLLDQVPRKDIEEVMEIFDMKFVDGVIGAGFQASQDNKEKMMALEERKQKLIDLSKKNNCFKTIGSLL